MLKFLIFEVYKDSVWSKMAQKTPVVDNSYVLHPNNAFDSELIKDWKVFMLEPIQKLYLPPKAHIGAFMQFGPEDMGPEYNMSSPAGYKSIKFGKEFKNTKTDPTQTLTRADFNHDTWEDYTSLDEMVIWQFGNNTNKFVLQVYGEKTEPCEARRNYETCELALYSMKKVYIHVSPDTFELLKTKIDEYIKNLRS
jgi:hypothetical protein